MPRASLLRVFSLCLLALAISSTVPRAMSSDIVISQVYGGGGNSGATYKNDFVELYNRGAAAVSVDGWTIQYASSAGSTWQKTTLSGLIQPGRYYLVQEAAGAGAAPGRARYRVLRLRAASCRRRGEWWALWGVVAPQSPVGWSRRSPPPPGAGRRSTGGSPDWLR